MTLEKREELLGEFYLPLNERHTKEEYIDKINGFINLLPNFKPIIEYPSSSIFKMYAKENNVQFLDLFYFVNSHIPYELKGGNYNLGICVDENNIKHIILKRSTYTVNEMSKSLSLGTIKMLYKLFVYDMATPTCVIRGIKEVESNVANVKLPLITSKINEINQKESIFCVKEIFFDKKSRMLRYKCCSLNLDLISGMVNYNFSNGYNSVYTVDSMLGLFENNITMDYVNKRIEEMHELNIKTTISNHNLLVNKLKTEFALVNS